jgi:TolB-like protein
MKKVLLILILSSVIMGKDRTTVAINTFDPQGVDTNTAMVLTGLMSSYLHETGEFQVLERATMNEILTEQQFQQSGVCSDEACIIEMGQLLGVTKMVAGTVSKLGRTYIIQARLIDVKTGAIDKFSKEECEGCKVDELRTSIKKMAYSFTTQKEGQAQITKKKSKKFLYIGIGGAVLAGGGLAAYLLTKGDDKTQEPEEQGAERFGDYPPVPNL